MDPDVFELDNVAYGFLEPSQHAHVLAVTPSNRFFQFARNTDHIKKLVKKLVKVQFKPTEFLRQEQYRHMALLGQFDLIIFDRFVPVSMPECNTLFFAAVPPGEQRTAGTWQFPSVTIEVLVPHPVMNSVQIPQVSFVEACSFSGLPETISPVNATFGSGMAIAPNRREYWPWIIAAAIAVLVSGWYIYNQRVLI